MTEKTVKLSRRNFFSEKARSSTAQRGEVREYWLQAESYETTSVPNKRNEFLGIDVTGSTNYVALRYRAYSKNWETPLLSSKEIGENSGVPAPIIRANVGDEIVVHFKNADEHYQQPHSIRAFGVKFDPANDGTWTANTQSAANYVKYGESFTYRWKAVPSSRGYWNYQDSSRPFDVAKPNDPKPGLQSNIGYELGLVGFILIEDGSLPKADREFFIVFHAYLSDIPKMMTTMDINGFAFLGNTPNFRAKAGERVRWYVMGARQTYDHNFHVHGHRWWTGHKFEDVVTTQADEVEMVEWVEDNPGQWLYHCHVEGHMEMSGWYFVEAKA